jgi:hypothetical protein
MTAQADFLKCAHETVSVARDLYPQDPSIADRVAKAWSDVGVLTAPSAVATPIAAPPAPAPVAAVAALQALSSSAAAKPRRKKSKRGARAR